TEVNFGPFGDLWTTLPYYWAPGQLAVQVFDVSDTARPKHLVTADIRGVFVASRRIGDQLVLVTRHTPYALIDPAARPRLASLELDELLPTITIDGRERGLVDARSCYVSSDPGTGTGGHATLTTITTFSLANPRDFQSTCYDEPANGVYASQTALYVSQPRSGATASTRIHKFSLTAAAPRYAGSAEVPGQLWMSGQSDFRMSEHDGLLRVMTTEWTPDPADSVDHRLFVLRENAAGHALDITARLPNDARPEEIGKPNETLYGVRFVGDRAYAVTFRRIDPLYVIDLSTPSDPRIAGELQIPGTSDLLHPVSDDLLLGVGSDANRVKVELFDVSVPGSPQSRGALMVDGVQSWSEVTYDHHAFTYLPAAASDRLAIPATSSHPSFAPPLHVQTALFQYEVIGKQVAGSASLQAAGSVLPQPGGASYLTSALNRSFIDGDTVYYVRDGQVWSSSWFTPSQIRGPF
ncbi:MAG: beta-propeller domain-containing protein, partial [Myxococcales bacterium]|nr:beta-propeller domain-containing protein [Myxococcales bacterium]